MDAPFGRLLTAMITPFDREGAVDHGRVWELAHHLVETGSDGLVVAGSTGESPTLSDDEKVALFRAVVEAVGSRARVIAGTGTYDTAHSVELTRRAEAAGCHGAMAVTPYYNRPPQAGLVAHFEAIAGASGLPVMLYNIPARTGRRIEVDTLARLAAHPGILAVKDAVGDLAFTTETIGAVGGDMAVYSGDDVNTLPIMAVGGVGVVSVASHLAGRQLQRLVDAAAAGDFGRGAAPPPGPGPAVPGALPGAQPHAGEGRHGRVVGAGGESSPAPGAGLRRHPGGDPGGPGGGPAGMSVSLAFLGGLGEVGRNCTSLEIGGRLALIDCGLMFPEEGMLGVDLVLPDLSSVVARRADLDCVVLTHGHEDHVGALGLPAGRGARCRCTGPR